MLGAVLEGLAVALGTQIIENLVILGTRGELLKEQMAQQRTIVH